MRRKKKEIKTCKTSLCRCVFALGANVDFVLDVEEEQAKHAGKDEQVCVCLHTYVDICLHTDVVILGG